MAQNKPILPQMSGQMFYTDVGVETHLILTKGIDVPHFTVFQLNDSAAGRQAMRDYYEPYIDIARRAGQGFLFDTNTWRANPDWGALVGYDAERLRAVNIKAVALCREVARGFHAAVVPTVVSGAIGPRRDA